MRFFYCSTTEMFAWEDTWKEPIRMTQFQAASPVGKLFDWVSGGVAYSVHSSLHYTYVLTPVYRGLTAKCLFIYL